MRKSLFSALALLLCFSLSAPSLNAKPPEPRTLRVGVAVSPGIKTDREWQSRFRKRLDYASKIFQMEFKIQLKPTQFYDWPIQDESKGMTYLLESLKSSYPLKSVDLVIGLARLDEQVNPGNIQDMHVIGRAQVFTGYLVLRDPLKPMLNVQHETVLTHELGHLFGAIHVNDRDTIMSPVVDRQIPTSFDGENRQIISLTREMAFGKGAEALRERDVRSMLNAYLRFQVEDQPSSFYYSLGKMYIRLGKFNEALDAMRAANTREPNNPLIRYDVGVLYAKLGNQRQAIKELSWVVKQFSLPSEDPYKASALSLLGAAYFEQSNFDQAYRAWNKSLAIEPNNLDTRINLAMIQVRQNRLEEAIASFEKILVMSGASPKVLNNLATTYYRAENYQKSIEYLQRALKVAPKQTKRGNLTNYDGMQPSQLFTYLGQAYFKLGHTGAAISSYESACKLNPTVSCQQQLGELYFQARRFTEAAQTLLGVLEAGADNVNLYGVLGSALAEVKDYDRAVEIFTEGLRNAKDRNAKSDLHRNIGNLYIRMKKYDLARKEFQLAVTHNFKSQEARFGLAYALASQNRFKQAHDELKRILQRDPSFARARDLLSDVEKRL